MTTQPKKKINLTQLLRHLVQLVAFLLFPGLFLSTFNALRDIVQALIAGSFAFSAFTSQIVQLIVIFSVTILFGRFFCGYLCAFGAVQDLMALFSRKFRKKHPLPEAVDRSLKYIKYAVLLLSILLIWILQLPVDTSLSPWGVFGMLTSWNFSVMSAAIPTIGFVLLVLILTGSVFVERFFCRYLCPLGAMFTLVSGKRMFHIRRMKRRCVDCGLCSRACAMGIDVPRNASVRSGECIDCMQCLPSCPKAALRANPDPALVGTVSALTMCSLITAGNITDFALTSRSTSSTASQVVVEETTFISLSQELAAEEADKKDTNVHEEPKTEEVTNEDNQKTSEVMADVSSSETSDPVGPYTDGNFTGYGDGFRGTTSVSVTVEHGFITDIEILSYRDDRQFFSRASAGVISFILEAQNPNVSAVSGATFSSRGIMEAVADALEVNMTQTATEEPFEAEENPKEESSEETTLEEEVFEEENEEISKQETEESRDSEDEEDVMEGVIEESEEEPETEPDDVLEETIEDDPDETFDDDLDDVDFEETETAPSGSFADGVYTGYGTGYRGTTTVSVTVEGGEIIDIEILSYADDTQFFSRASSGVISDILYLQSVNVDTVSGATFSSRGIMEAVADALGLEYTNTNSSSGGSSGHHGH